MEVKPGYKQTEVGVIPEEWEAHRLGELLQGPRSIRYGIVQPGKFDATGCYMLRSQDYSKGWAGPDGMHKVSAQLENQYRNARIRHNDLVITVVGAGIGQVVVVPDWLDGAILSRSTARIAIEEDKAARNFVRAFLEGPLGKRQILDCQKEGAQPVVSCLDLAKFFVAYPPLPEQRAIATALSDVDGLLGGLDRLIAKKRDLKQAAMQQLLTGQTRLPGFHGEWEVKRLKKIVQTPVTDGPHLTPQFFDDGIPFLSVNNLVGNRIDLTDLRFISQQDHKLFSRKCKPRKDDILLGKAASVGKVAIVELDYEFNIWSPIALIRVSSDHVPRFIYYQLQSADLIGQITLLTNSSSQGNIGMGDIEKLILKLPPLPEQTAIASVLSEMDGELAVLEQRREKTRALKQAMMQELLTGKTRLI